MKRQNYIETIEGFAKQIHPLKPIDRKVVGRMMVAYDDFLEKLTELTTRIVVDKEFGAEAFLINFLRDELFERCEEDGFVPTMNPATDPGWMSPTGIYYPLDYSKPFENNFNRWHAALAEDLWEQFYAGDVKESPEEWATEQTDLMRQGWLRFDYTNIQFMRRPTAAQKKTVQAMFDYKLGNVSLDSRLEFHCYEEMQRLINWLDGDATEEYDDFERMAGE